MLRKELARKLLSQIFEILEIWRFFNIFLFLQKNPLNFQIFKQETEYLC